MGRPHPPMAAHHSMLLSSLLLVSRQQRAAMVLLRLLLRATRPARATWLSQAIMGALRLQRRRSRRLLRGLVLQRHEAQPRCPASRLLMGLPQLGPPWLSRHGQARLQVIATAMSGLLGNLPLAARPTSQLPLLRLFLTSPTCCTLMRMLTLSQCPSPAPLRMTPCWLLSLRMRRTWNWWRRPHHGQTQVCSLDKSMIASMDPSAKPAPQQALAKAADEGLHCELLRPGQCLIWSESCDAAQHVGATLLMAGSNLQPCGLESTAEAARCFACAVTKHGAAWPELRSWSPSLQSALPFFLKDVLIMLSC